MPNPIDRRRRAGRTLIVLASVLALLAILFLTLNVSREIAAQGSAQSDNVQWSLSQTEVEFQEFSSRLRIGANPAEIRRRFDIFYSRIQTVRQARVFADLRASEEFEGHLARTEAFLEEAVKLVDVDVVGLEPAQGSFDSLGNRLR